MGRCVAQIPNEDPHRLGRVLDAKYRTIGVDVAALQQQSADRKQAEAMAADRDLQYARLANLFDTQVKLKQQEADAVAAQQAREEMAIRLTHQQKHTTREWDLNRPDALRIDQPARLGDQDPRLGTSSLQKFEGEDLSAGERKASQMQQSKAWLEGQSIEKAARDDVDRQREAAHAELAKYCDALQQAAMAQEQNIRRSTNVATREDNARLAELQRDLRNAEREWEQMMGNHEIECALHNPVLTEDPSIAASALSPVRVRKDHWKGMTPEEKRAIFEEQFRQTEELKAKRQAERSREAGWARTALQVDQALKEQQRMADEFRKQQEADRLRFLQVQADEKRCRDIKLNDTYANQVAPEYFAQFGTSHR